ncbi:MAG TPA: hypothetical protein VHY09_04860 [Candidatus Methylacidiphilales bacterium]|nr:hypothetical protein [Candidatus Methylacidiphilales bacterium]
MSKSKAAFEFSAKRLGKEKLYFWTFTFAEVLAVKSTRKKWNYLLTLLRRRYPKLCGLRAFELHEEHGLHVHLVTNGWIDVNEARVMAVKAGWGRIHVKRIPAEKALYMGKYLSKEDRAPCLKGWRLWAAFGAWESTKVKDVKLDSEFSTIIRELIATKGRLSYFKRLALADEIYFKRVAEG